MVSEWNKYSKSIATQLFYQHIPIDTAFYKYFVCYNYKLNTLTDVPYQMTAGGGHLFTYVKTWERGRVGLWTPTTVL